MAGCGGDAPDLGVVSGVVTQGGQPVANATVEFVPETGRPSYATTGPDGRYALAFAADQPGAAVGTHSVRVTTRSTSLRSESLLFGALGVLGACFFMVRSST